MIEYIEEKVIRCPINCDVSFQFESGNLGGGVFIIENPNRLSLAHMACAYNIERIESSQKVEDVSTTLGDCIDQILGREEFYILSAWNVEHLVEYYDFDDNDGFQVLSTWNGRKVKEHSLTFDVRLLPPWITTSIVFKKVFLCNHTESTIIELRNCFVYDLPVPSERRGRLTTEDLCFKTFSEDKFHVRVESLFRKRNSLNSS